MNEEKRAHPRFLFSEPVVYGHPEVTVNGSVAENISLSGISLKVQEFVPLGTVLELQIRLQQYSPKVLWIKAEVVRAREISDGCFEIGLRFIKDEAVTKAIGGYIDAFRELNQHHQARS